KINTELKAYDENVSERPQIIVANKMDMPGADENLQSFKDQLKDDSEIFPISALTRDGLCQLLFAIADKLDEIPKETLLYEDVVEITHTEKKPSFIISRADDGAFIITSEKVERMFSMTAFSTAEGAQ